MVVKVFFCRTDGDSENVLGLLSRKRVFSGFPTDWGGGFSFQAKKNVTGKVA